MVKIKGLGEFAICESVIEDNDLADLISIWKKNTTISDDRIVVEGEEASERFRFSLPFAPFESLFAHGQSLPNQHQLCLIMRQCANTKC
jgi:hypothetical protein